MLVQMVGIQVGPKFNDLALAIEANDVRMIVIQLFTCVVLVHQQQPLRHSTSRGMTKKEEKSERFVNT